jgi:hypothetical protein
VRSTVAAMRRAGAPFALAGDGSEGLCDDANVLYGALGGPVSLLNVPRRGASPSNRLGAIIVT